MVLGLPSHQLSCFATLANLSQDLPLGANAPLSQDGFQCTGVWGRWGMARLIMAWCPLPFDPRREFLRMCSVSLALRRGNM